jgi:GTP 3',8-cyclase
MYDRCNRRIHYLRVSVTDRCNLRCCYCMPAGGVQSIAHGDVLSFERIRDIVAAATRLGIDKVRLTGGEPLVRKGITSLVSMLRAVPGLGEVAMTSNGLLLPELAGDLKRAGLDRLNISLDSLDPLRYARITRGGDLTRALAGIEAARTAGFVRTKINMVLIPGENDHEQDAFQRFCTERGLELQRIRHYSLTRQPPTRPGFDAERPLACSQCNRIRLTADGHLKPCLFSNLEIPVDAADPVSSLRRAILAKPEAGTACENRQIWQIGG